MFSRAVFYQLRDVAAQLGSSSDACLRYSESALELEYAVPRLQQRRQTPLERGALMLLGLAFVSAALWPFDRHDKVALVTIIIVGGGWIARIIHNPARVHIGFVGRVRITLNAERPVFRFETLMPVAGPPPPIGAELPAAAIRDIRLRIIASHDEHEPNLGLVEIMTEELPPTLFAALPAPAAEELVQALRSLTGLPAPDRSTLAWFRRQGRRLGRLPGQRRASR